MNDPTLYWSTALSDIATLLAQKYIARRDVKAVQHADGSWSPHTDTGRRDGARLKWRMADLNSHIEKTATYGHYLLDADDKCKLFAFDIDLEKNTPPDSSKPFTGSYVDADGDIQFFDARESWSDRKHPARPLLKIALMQTAFTLGTIIRDELDLECAVAYSGGKGVHVYAFTGLLSAKDAREGAQIVMESFDEFEPTRGDNFWRDKDQRLENITRNLTIEVFPKQDSLEGKDLGNLMRLPLGRNLKRPKDPCFFIDMTKGLTEMSPIDPVIALTTEAAWRADA